MISQSVKDKYCKYDKDGIIILHGDCRVIMAELEAESIDAVISDPPYGLEFMGKDWDKAVPGPEYWTAALRVCKPGAMLMAFGGTRLVHRLTCAIEDAGFEIRDCLMWLYGTGWPKSLDISKAIDKEAGAEREVIGKRTDGRYASKGTDITGGNFKGGVAGGCDIGIITAPATEAAQQWDGWGTALKPAWEPIVLSMKPLDGTFAGNALKHGVAGLHIDGARLGSGADKSKHFGAIDKSECNIHGGGIKKRVPADISKGRWPANVMLDQEAADMLDAQSGESVSGKDSGQRGTGGMFSKGNGVPCGPQHGDAGGASRFFYIAKPSPSDRGKRDKVELPLFGEVDEGFKNTHPTVKPVPLMIRLIETYKYIMSLLETPTGGVILDPFGGSGTTAIAAKQMGRQCIVIERDIESVNIMIERLKQGAP